MKQFCFQYLYLPAVAICVIVLSCMSGCNTSGCADNHSALPQMGFYNATTGKPLTLDSLDLWGVGVPNDSMLIKSGQRVQQLYFPLRNNQNETAYCFHYDYKEQGLNNPEFDDILRIRYTTEPYFASEECGAFYIYHITDISYTRHLIDKIEVVDSIINNVDMERFRIYFRVAEESPENPDNSDSTDETDTPGESDTSDDETDTSETSNNSISSNALTAQGKVAIMIKAERSAVL